MTNLCWTNKNKYANHARIRQLLIHWQERLAFHVLMKTLTLAWTTKNVNNAPKDSMWTSRISLNVSHVQNKHLSTTPLSTSAKNAHGMLGTIAKLYIAKVFAYQHKFMFLTKTHVSTLKTHAHMMKYTHRDRINVWKQSQHALMTNFTINNKPNVSHTHLCVNWTNITINQQNSVKKIVSCVWQIKHILMSYTNVSKRQNAKAINFMTIK